MVYNLFFSQGIINFTNLLLEYIFAGQNFPDVSPYEKSWINTAKCLFCFSVYFVIDIV